MSLRRGHLGALGLTVIALVAFLPTLWVGFIADDYGLFYTAHHYAGLGWAFDRNDAGEAGAAGHFYRPLWVLWNAGVFKLSHDNTIAIHAAGIALFAVIVLEVWALARRLLSAEAA